MVADMNSPARLSTPRRGRPSRVAVAAALVLLLVAAPTSVNAADDELLAEARRHSRHAIEDLAFRSGLGIPINAPEEFLTGVEGSLENIADATLLQAVYSSAVVPAGWETADLEPVVSPTAQARW